MTNGVRATPPLPHDQRNKVQPHPQLAAESEPAVAPKPVAVPEPAVAVQPVAAVEAETEAAPLPSVQLDRMLIRLALLILIVNIPYNRFGTSLARAMPNDLPCLSEVSPGRFSTLRGRLVEKPLQTVAAQRNLVSSYVLTRQGNRPHHFDMIPSRLGALVSRFQARQLDLNPLRLRFAPAIQNRPVQRYAPATERPLFRCKLVERLLQRAASLFERQDSPVWPRSRLLACSHWIRALRGWTRAVKGRRQRPLPVALPVRDQTHATGRSAPSGATRKGSHVNRGRLYPV